MNIIMRKIKLFEEYIGNIKINEPIPQNKNVIFFDGVCGLCNKFVDFILKIDHDNEFIFTPLQGEFAKKVLPEKYTQDMKSVILLKNNGDLYSQSKAVIEILSDIGGVWKLAKIANILPDTILDKAYDLVSENRYKIFGKKDTCRLPKPGEKDKFIN
jgi:predicted DCC family thiol-disulfide oxidoreductase YuxK